MTLRHTPYDGSSHPFGIGLRPLDLANWIEIDEKLPEFLAEKHRLLEEIPDQIWAGDFASEAAQNEVLSMLLIHLLERYPNIYRQTGPLLDIAGQFEVDVNEVSRPPLMTASLLVQEDLVLMGKTEAGWRLVAGSVCFPSSWRLRDKAGKLMHEVHAPVPGFAKGSRNAGMIERVFDNLQVELPVERFNWSVYGDDRLFQPGHSGEHVNDKLNEDGEPFLRVEHQTLRKLPVSKDILFTIRIHLDPLDALRNRDDRKELGQGFIQTIRAMDEAQLQYKGLDHVRDELISRIEAVTA